MSVPIDPEWIQHTQDDGTALCVIDLKAVPDLLKAIQMVLDEHTGSSEPKQN